MKSFFIDLSAYAHVDKPKSPLRWVILVLSCLQLIGSYYCYDIPAALKTQIEDYMGDTSQYELYFSLLYTVYSVPNVILPFFGGYYTDNFGIRICLLIFASLVGLGQILVSFGLSIKSWYVIFIGRLIFGFGGESLTVANSALLADWFKGKELALAFGINLAVARCGSVVNNVTSPVLASSPGGVVFASWFGAILCAMSVGNVLAVFPIDRAFDRVRDANALKNLNKSNSSSTDNMLLNNEKDPIEDSSIVPSTTTTATAVEAKDTNRKEKGIQFRDCLNFPKIFWLIVLLCIVVYGCVLPFNNIASSLLLERDYFQAVPAGCTLSDPTECESSTNVPLNCPSSSWYQPPLPSNITTSEVDCTSDYWSATNSCTYTYCNRLSNAEKHAGVIMSIPYLISAGLAPILGYFVDQFGLRALIAAFSPVILVSVHSILGFSDINPIGPLIGQGFAYAFFAAVLWPCVPLITEAKYTGLAFGVLTAVLNLGTAILPLVVASIYSDSNDKYIPNVEILFISLGFLGFMIGCWLNYEDHVNNHDQLNLPQIFPTDGKDGGDLKEKLLDHVDACYDYDSNAIDRPFFNSVDSTPRVNRDGRYSGSFTIYSELFQAGAFDQKKIE